MSRAKLHVSVLCSMLAVLGCGSGRKSVARARLDEPLKGELRQGQIAYMRYCDSCHPGGAAGLGPSLNDKPIPRAAVALQVRQGLGAMPAFDESVIADPDLDVLTRYVEWLSDLPDDD